MKRTFLGGGCTQRKSLVISRQKGKNRQKCTPLFKFSHEKIEGSVMPVKKQQKELPQYENAPKIIRETDLSDSSDSWRSKIFAIYFR